MARLGDVGRVITGNTPKTSDAQNYTSNDIYFVKPSDILDGEIEITGYGSEIAQQAVETYRAVIVRRIIVQETENVIPADELIDIIFGRWKEDSEMIVELICRKLYKLGLLEATDGAWKKVGEDKKENNE